MHEQETFILYVLTKLELGGAQKICLSLLKGLRSPACTTALVSGTQGALTDQAAAIGNLFLLESMKREVGIKMLWSEWKTFWSLVRIMRSLRAQHPRMIVHTHSTKAGVLGRWAAWVARVSNRVHTVHGFGFNQYQSWPVWLLHVSIEWITSLITTHYVCVSKRDQTTGSYYFPRFMQKSSIIRAAVDWDHFYQPAIKSERIDGCTFGLIGCFKPQKNIFDALTAFAFFYADLPADQRVGVSFQIIGDGALRPAIEQWIADNELVDVVQLLGWQADVAPFLRQWDVLVSSSLWEGLPCALVEARLSKLPIIAYDVGGIAEVICDGRNGYLIEPGDIATLTQRMKLLFHDVQLRAALSCHEQNLDDFKIKSMLDNHALLYKNLQ